MGEKVGRAEKGEERERESYASKTSHSHRVAGEWIGRWRQSGWGGERR